MSNICVARDSDIKSGYDFFLRTYSSGKQNESRVSVSFPDMDPYISSTDLDLCFVAAGLFEYESLLRREVLRGDGSITFVTHDSTGFDSDGVSSALEDLLSFTIKTRPRVKMIEMKSDARASVKKFKKKNSCTLFSGGVDSLSGITRTNQSLGPTFGMFVSHDRMLSRVNAIEQTYLKPQGLHIHKALIQRPHTGLQQLRGFVYLVFGAIAARAHQTENVVITETGQTMYQPELTALDEVTVTTHPTLMRITKKLLREICGKDFLFYEPFENLTKAEVVSLCQNKPGIPSTNSCRTTRWANSPISHCGDCFGCLIRKVACIVAGVKDASYAKDVLMMDLGESVEGRRPNETLKKDDLVGLQTLLRFARDDLEDKLDDVAAFKIRSFGKEELYNRAALDIFAALHLLYGRDGSGRNKWVRGFYEECKQDGVVKSETIENRIAEVRSQKYGPNFAYKL